MSQKFGKSTLDAFLDGTKIFGIQQREEIDKGKNFLNMKTALPWRL